MALDVPNSDHPLDLRAASRDLWPGGTLDFWQGRSASMPGRVFWPEDAEQVASVLEHATRQSAVVVPYGAGSGVCNGVGGAEGRWVIDVKRMDRILDLDEAAGTVTVEAGVNGQHLEDWLKARGYTLGHSPSSIWCSTVGGWAAARGAGQFSSRYGVFEDMVVALEFVAPGTGVRRVGLGGNAPASWLPMLLGSEGTLAVLTRLVLRVAPRPKARWLRGYKVADVTEAVDVMRRLMQAELHPAVVRLYDPVDTRIGGKTRPKSEHGKGSSDFLKQWLGAVDALPGARQRSLALPLRLPGLVNSLFDRMAEGCLLVAGWEGDAEVVEAQSTAGHELLCSGAEDLGPGPGERWYASRHAVSYKLAPVFERGGFADTMEIAARWSQLVPAYEAVRQAVRSEAVVMAHMSHLYPEGGSIYFSFAGRGDRAVYERLWARALDAVHGAGATTTHHHGVGRLKAEVASREVGAARAGWKALKQTLDPNGLMNPGNLFCDAPATDAPRFAEPPASDGLVRVEGAATYEHRRMVADSKGLEIQFPWAGPPIPRWQRRRWEIAWTEVSGTVDGQWCSLGRGPRSATGPDLRGFVAQSEDAEVSWPAVPRGSRWMGRARVDQPWRAAHVLLRSDLRPAVLTVQDGMLMVGFRGPAAEELGRIASARVPGGLTACDYVAVPFASGPLEPCDWEDPRICWVNELGAWRPMDGS